MKQALLGLGLLASGLSSWPQAALAQSESLLLEPSLPADYDRGRNVSVTERARPDYDPLGLHVGSFLVFPQIQAGAGYSSNIYLDDSGERTDAPFVFLSPSVRAVSDWSRHRVQFRGSGTLRRFINESARNEDVFSIAADGRYDVSSEVAVSAEGQFAQFFESPLSGEVDPGVSALSNYQRASAGLRAEYRVGQIRAIAAVDRADFDFSNITLPDGTVRSQADRDRTIERLSGQLQYAWTPSASVYGRAFYTEIDYDQALANGNANRDSKGTGLIAGLNLDLAGFLRGIVGVGYLWREYHSPLYRDVQGFSAEARLEYFPSELTTVTLAGRRVIEDSNLGTSNAYFDTRLSARVDHELLRNLILYGQGEASFQNFIGTTDKSNVYRISSGARYLSSRDVALELGAAYGTRNSNSISRAEFDEFRVQASLILQR
ncbi:outer membrane beta-barrel protein [Novosphingobium sp. RD2P27]|uniref:Outer membrane beta-barrel protein n=1 Tax=Novosphingobium kalidii TaxID=3230299 RepID=A0ABV2CZZ4_9SPHN